MPHLKLLLASLSLFTLAATGAACDTADAESCPRGECPVVQPPSNDPTGDDDRPAPCAEACRNLLEECEASATASADALECERDCRAEFTSEEAECLAGLACGESTDACL